MDDDMSSSECSIHSQLRGEREAKDGGHPGSTGGEVDEGGASGRRVDVRLLERRVLTVRVSCRKEYGVLARLFQVVERHRLLVDNAGILSFADLEFDITIFAQLSNPTNFMDDDMSSSERSVNSQLRDERETEDGGDPDPGSTGGEVDVSVSERSVWVSVSCRKEYGVLARLFQVVERHRLMVDNAKIFSFDLEFDITIVAQMEVDGNTNKEDLVKDINIALGSSN